MEINELLSRPAEEFGNDESLEQMWAAKAFEHAHIYFNLVSSVDPKLLHLTQIDQTIYSIFRNDFPNLTVKVLNDDEMKSNRAKIRWRLFCEKFKDLVEDYNYGTLLRLNCEDAYNEVNSILVTKIQFLAIEIARNLEGCNDCLRKKFLQTKKDK